MAETDSDRFAGKVAFVTGAGGGIGRATALAFAAEAVPGAVRARRHRGPDAGRHDGLQPPQRPLLHRTAAAADRRPCAASGASTGSSRPTGWPARTRSPRPTRDSTSRCPPVTGPTARLAAAARDRQVDVEILDVLAGPSCRPSSASARSTTSRRVRSRSTCPNTGPWPAERRRSRWCSCATRRSATPRCCRWRWTNSRRSRSSARTPRGHRSWAADRPTCGVLGTGEGHVRPSCTIPERDTGGEAPQRLVQSTQWTPVAARYPEVARPSVG